MKLRQSTHTHVVLLLTLTNLCAVAQGDRNYRGTAYPLKDKAPTVQLVREYVKFDIHQEYYQTTATYLFHNLGSATDVSLVFGDADFSDLQVWMDDRKVRPNRVALQEKEDIDYQWRYSPRFSSGGHHKLKVSFRSGYLGMATVPVCRYQFAGSGWSGKVTESSVTAEIHVSGAFRTSAYLENRDGAKVRQPLHATQQRCFVRWQNRTDDGNFELVFQPTISPDWLSFEGADPDSATLHLHGKPQAVGGFLWLPPALVRDGVTFIAIEHLEYRLKSNDKGYPYGQKKGEAILEAGKHNLQFVEGKASMVADGKEVSLPAAPFSARGMLHGPGPYHYFYVPLIPVLKVIGGQANVNQKEHRIYLGGPLFHKPEEAD